MSESREALAAERDQLRRENEALSRQLDEARQKLATAEQQQGASTTAAGRRAPQPPSYGMSEGERSELEQRGVTRSPWTGEQLLADEQGVQTSTEEAQQRQEQARARRGRGGDEPTVTTADTTLADPGAPRATGRAKPVRDDPQG